MKNHPAKTLTFKKLLFLPVILIVSILIVALFGALFDSAFAQDDVSATSWFKDNLAPIMFAFMIILLVSGYPTAFALAGVGMLFGIFGIALGELELGLYNTMPSRLFGGIMGNETLLAIPFFTFMGLILERSGMAEDLLDTIGQLFGPIRGGLGYAVIFVGALLAATTGVVAASVISMGLISLPIMMRYGYDRPLASGTIAAAGTLAQIIPPSLVLIVMADQLGRSVGDMYTAAIVPGLMLVALYAFWVFIYSMFNPKVAPGIPLEAIKHRKADGGRGLLSLLFFQLGTMALAYFISKEYGLGFLNRVKAGTAAALELDEFVVILLLVWMLLSLAVAWFDANLVKIGRPNFLSPLARATTFVLVPPLFLIFLVLGTIIIGIATPTEGGAMGAVGALILAFIKRLTSGEVNRINFKIVELAITRTAKLSAFVLFILIGARLFTLTFFGVSGQKWVENILMSVAGNQLTYLIIISVIVFILGCFLDFFEITFIVVPLLLPTAEALGIDLIWLGVILSVNLQSSFLTPPFGFALIYIRSVASGKPYKDPVTGQIIDPIETLHIYRGVLPYIIMQVIMIIVVIAFPSLVMHYKNSSINVDAAEAQEQMDNLGQDLNLDLDLDLGQ